MDLILRSQQSDLQKNITDIKHKCDLINSKYELETKHFNELQGRNINDKDYKKNVLDKNNKDLQEYIKKITLLNTEIVFSSTTSTSCCDNHGPCLSQIIFCVLGLYRKIVLK